MGAKAIRRYSDQFLIRLEYREEKRGKGVEEINKKGNKKKRRQVIKGKQKI